MTRLLLLVGIGLAGCAGPTLSCPRIFIEGRCYERTYPQLIPCDPENAWPCSPPQHLRQAQACPGQKQVNCLPRVESVRP